MFGRTINNSEEKEKSIGDVPSSILDKVLDFDEHESFTLNGIQYETP